ncbi:MAG: TetR/AcrR family transcriptional regulator [Chloroflexota bacterium]
MARPKSEEKRLALLNAAAEAVAEHGLAAAPTSLIAKRAGVAEGTLFRYFSTKDDLLNELYVHLKQNMCEALVKHYVPTDPFRSRVQSLWNSYIDWGLANPLANKVVNQLAVSSVIKPETQARTNEMFPDMDIATRFSENDVFAGREEFAEAVFIALADTTMAFAAREPDKAKDYKASGFAALWKMYGDG